MCLLFCQKLPDYILFYLAIAKWQFHLSFGCLADILSLSSFTFNICLDYLSQHFIFFIFLRFQLASCYSEVEGVSGISELASYRLSLFESV